MTSAPAPLDLRVGPDLEAAHAQARKTWARARGTARLWAKDASLWTGADEARWLGWLDVASRQRARARRFRALGWTAAQQGLREVVVLGMGGSSLWPEVVRVTLADRSRGLMGRVLDTTDPEVLLAARDEIDPARTLWLASSKSGTTLETRLLAAWARAQVPAPIDPLARTAVITDPGSALWRAHVGAGAWAVFAGEPQIGGRFSALSDFGLVPAALMGADVPGMLDAAVVMERACRAPEVADNPGVDLGLALAAAAEQGRDKLTILADPDRAPFALWLEQLLSESTGKQGQGIAVVVDEPLGAAGCYRDDRLFLRLSGAQPGAALDELAQELAAGGHPVIRTPVPDPRGLAAEVLRWSVAVAVCAARMEINPFDQPDVEATKAATRARLGAGAAPAPEPDAVGRGLALWGVVPPGPDRLAAALGHLMGQLPVRGELSLLAYVPDLPEVRAPLQKIRARVRDARGTATTLGFGPRYLHSTGQLHKGGQGGRVHLMITRTPAREVEAPGQDQPFGAVQRAQAQADAQVLRARGCAVLEVHVADGGALPQALGELEAAFGAALSGGA